MAYTTINKHTDFYSTKTFQGSGSAQSITGVGHQPDLTWFKNTATSSRHQIYDAVRGNTKLVNPDSTDAEQTVSFFTSFDSDGYTIPSGSSALNGTDTICSWNWKAGTTSGITTNGSTTITPTGYSFNTTSKFSIIAYTGNGTSGAKIPHGLGVAPDVILIKKRSSGANIWAMYHSNIGATHYLQFDTSGATDNNVYWNDTAPDTVNFTVGDASPVNSSSTDYIAYCWTNLSGYCKAGKYVGKGNDSPYVHTGFKPSFILIKLTSATSDWQLFDNKRLGYNDDNDYLNPNSNGSAQTADLFEIYSNGFRVTDNNSWGWNRSGEFYRYLAFGQTMVGTNGVPATGR